MGLASLSPQIVRAISQRNKRKLPITLDSRFNLLDFQGLTAATPNEPEVEASLAHQDWNEHGVVGTIRVEDF